MKETINFSRFCNAFRDMNRLFDYLESIEDDTDTEIELDVIALCCDYSEYANLKELQENYTDIESMDDLNDHTIVIMVDDKRFIIQQF